MSSPSGRMFWTAVVPGRLASAICLGQDRDGLQSGGNRGPITFRRSA